MSDLKLGAIETRFAELIWENEPITTANLVKLCAEALQWKRTTTYTVLKKLSEKGIFKTENSVVTAIISKQEFEAMQSEQFVEETFKGSLPAFLAAFSTRKKLSDKEIDEMKNLIEQMRR
ncbi:MAG: BlaI/MecI/CopY family transcriptional regulator [Oscillospiraceae bacterium]|nr:BlaI/MecI/CopY family transcriptional regulator [Oscillospiraceae bacterium]